MKEVSCSYEGCSDRRIHWSRPDEPRPRRIIEVPDDHEGPMYCSITCACYDGAMSVRVKPCKCGAMGTLRRPKLADMEEANKMAYYACDKCFNSTWAGEL